MANPQRGEVDLEIDGTTYTLALDLDAMCEIEEALSTPDRRVSFQDVARGLLASQMTYVRVFFWGALRRYHPEITLKGRDGSVSSLMRSAGGLASFLEKLGALMAMTQPDEGDAKALEANGRPTGAAPAAPAAAVRGIGGRSTGKRARSA